MLFFGHLYLYSLHSVLTLYNCSSPLRQKCDYLRQADIGARCTSESAFTAVMKCGSYNMFCNREIR